MPRRTAYAWYGRDRRGTERRGTLRTSDLRGEVQDRFGRGWQSLTVSRDGIKVAEITRSPETGKPGWRVAASERPACPACAGTGAVEAGCCTCEGPYGPLGADHHPDCGLEPCPRGCEYVPPSERTTEKGTDRS